MVDKKYCMSSYLAFRYIADERKDFYPGIHHRNICQIPLQEQVFVYTADDIGREIEKQFAEISGKKLGVLLSGGMDSAIVASYMPGSDAYTFRFLGGSYGKEELKRAEYYADYYHLAMHYVDIGWETVEKYVDAVMQAKAAPVHSIEPQIYQAALQAKEDGVELMAIGESSDLIFGGMDKLLAKEWTYNEFIKRYTFTDPFAVLKEPQSMEYLYRQYQRGADGIDYLKFMDDVFSIESAGSYWNAFTLAGIDYLDPYAKLRMAVPLDLQKVRNGQPKYLVRELMQKRYPDIKVPKKVPMPRPVDAYFKDWPGPKRPEFKDGLNISGFTGNQRWQIWCLERFLDLYQDRG